MPYTEHQGIYFEETIAEINSNPDILPNTTLIIKCTIGNPLQTAIDHFREDGAIASIVGAYVTAGLCMHA